MQAVYKACCSLQAWDGMKPCLSSIHAGLCARNELPLPACCVPGFCPSAAIISPTFHSSLVLHVVILQWVITASGCPPCACPVSVHQAAAAYPPCPLHQLQRSNPVKPGCKNHHSIAWGLAELQSLVTGVLVHCLLFLSISFLKTRCVGHKEFQFQGCIQGCIQPDLDQLSCLSSKSNHINTSRVVPWLYMKTRASETPTSLRIYFKRTTPLP